MHPCVSCGACCATFWVVFDKAELTAAPYNVPTDLTQKVDADRRCLLGTWDPKPRCVALEGRIGKTVGCTIYAQRPSCCRDFKPSFEDGTRNARCDLARKNKGMRPLRASDYAPVPAESQTETEA